MTQQSNSNVWFGLAIIILLGFFFFKWLPDWLWRPATPEISINSYIFEPKVTWLAENATIEYYTAPDVYIRINPESAADSRAHLSVTVNNSPVDDNCSHSARYFCHKIDRTTVRTGDIYEITAKNDAGEAHATLKISIKDSKSTSNSSSSSSGSSSSSASSNGSSSNSAGSSANSSTEAQPRIRRVLPRPPSQIKTTPQTLPPPAIITNPAAAGTIKKWMHTITARMTVSTVAMAPALIMTMTAMLSAKIFLKTPTMKAGTTNTNFPSPH
ncbi:hypothetical protein IKE83_00620 [Candidatus Saccharibacteria bacterium]|nr:hypothetical protein [Candidatus Saccharibacteria bacterium]